MKFIMTNKPELLIAPKFRLYRIWAIDRKYLVKAYSREDAVGFIKSIDRNFDHLSVIASLHPEMLLKFYIHPTVEKISVSNVLKRIIREGIVASSHKAESEWIPRGEPGYCE